MWVILPSKGRSYAGISTPVPRFIPRAEAEGRLVNANPGWKVLSLIITGSNQVVFPAVAPSGAGRKRKKSGRRKGRAI